MNDVMTKHKERKINIKEYHCVQLQWAKYPQCSALVQFYFPAAPVCDHCAWQRDSAA